jgi:hypothetical protein
VRSPLRETYPTGAEESAKVIHFRAANGWAEAGEKPMIRRNLRAETGPD